MGNSSRWLRATCLLPDGQPRCSWQSFVINAWQKRNRFRFCRRTGEHSTRSPACPTRLFERLIDDGTIRRDVSYADINKVLRIEKVKADEVRILNLVPIVGKLRTLVFDLGWDYDWLSLAAGQSLGTRCSHLTACANSM